MSAPRFSWQAALAALLSAAALIALPLLPGGGAWLSAIAPALTLAAAIGAGLVARPALSTALAGIAAHLAAFLLIAALGAASGQARWSYFLALAAAWLLAWRFVTQLSGDGRAPPPVWARPLVPALFGLWVLVLWEAIARGAGIPFVLLPPPSAIGARIAASLPLLAADFNQTVLKAVLTGFAVGSGAGLLVAVLADRHRAFADALLPIGNMISALPIVGIAPIMVIWFEPGWHSSAAVVAVMTFFPMLVNAIAGLAAAGAMEKDLMRTYAAGHWRTLLALRLPAALPFVFNALKINSTLALIGAIVSEFFGASIVGMGFRISAETGRMNLDMVWAEIALAAVSGSLFYAILALAERAATFWHPSYRRQ
jgi:NitT/TauT family transport system permease protein